MSQENTMFYNGQNQTLTPTKDTNGWIQENGYDMKID